MRKILYITPSDITDIVSKGVQDLILDRNEGGFFDFCLTLIPFGRTNLQYNTGKDNLIIQYGWKTGINALDKYKITKIIGTVIILFKLFFIFPRILKKEKIDIIRATDPYLMGLLGVYYSKILKIPLVISIHSDYDLGFKSGGKTFTIFGSRKFPKVIENFVYKKSFKIFPISDYLKTKLIKNFKISHTKISIYPHGINFEEFDNIEYINIKHLFGITSKFLIGYVARLSKEKNCHDILYIAKKLQKIRKDFTIVVIGNGEEFNFMKNFINKNNLNKYIFLSGFQEKKIVYNLRKQAFVNLCLLDGYSLIEACAAGRPVIAYDVEWHYELVKDNETGFLIKEGHIDKVVEKINFLLNNPEIAKQLGLKVRELAFKRHELKVVTKMKQKIYNDILNDFKKCK